VMILRKADFETGACPVKKERRSQLNVPADNRRPTVAGMHMVPSSRCAAVLSVPPHLRAPLSGST
jgi:hypothetical protein